MSAAGNKRSTVMTRGVVVIHLSKLGGRLDPHQKVMLDADAKVIAHVLGYEYGGRHQAAKDYPVPVFFVPDDTLLVEEASGPPSIHAYDRSSAVGRSPSSRTNHTYRPGRQTDKKVSDQGGAARMIKLPPPRNLERSSSLRQHHFPD